MSERTSWFTASLGLGLACLITCAGSCLERRRAEPDSSEITRCAQCHGDATRSGDYLARSAPPHDLRSANTVDSPGVGAHARHLEASETHAAIACIECHIVPKHTDDPGHADSSSPAELEFGSLAKTGGRDPAYNAAARTCSDTWCHRSADAVWTAPREAESACGTCHGLPPKAPHPQSERCVVCHAEVVDEARHIIAPSLHVDGTVQYAAGRCAQCHGSEELAAPPLDTHGNRSPEARGVGAHAAHLDPGPNARPLACSECHQVPEKIEDPTHADGLPAEVQLVGVAQSQGFSARWDANQMRCADTWCHSPLPSSSPEPARRQASPRWDQPQALPCGGCHGVPPPAPHPAATQCGFCHGDVIGPDHRSVVDRERHVDGHVDVAVGTSCTGCHGSTERSGDERPLSIAPAPPLDLAGNSDPAKPGVGAHQTHLRGTANSKPVPCTTCHLVPDSVLASTHLDGAPADVVFSDVATAFGAKPHYENGRCTNTACHGAVFPENHESGGSQTMPSWTQVGKDEAACGSCHGLPPPRPHPYRENSPDCSDCHENVGPDNRSFVRPDLHVDGVVTFTVP